MKTKFTTVLFSVLALGFASSAMAVTCTSTSSFGNLGPPDTDTFGASFSSNGSYTNCYTFQLASTATAFGGALEIDSAFLRGIDLEAALYSGTVTGGHTTGGRIGAVDTSPSDFSFGNLSAGWYSLAIFSDVSGLYGTVGFRGSITTSGAGAPPVSVAEPGALALMGLGLAALGFLLRRRLVAGK
ncbi:MAG TPA: PEP-CTERM sorting domain-containing protein [Steroidobacteraceae bacterium]|nr:PEP-CTERM sorting domain-containing protein [Steroidobacteraceae bacterium]